ncbi:hypothetical protein BDQ12DRAFT_708726 [Crucibulum laeve]|uniref:F-box domain-containing protein n=1 Tax=Crucibulum laeve TaxID=68775 RepID=A0A5C3MIA5_9AGAR|nr:hypothetical protein BDQ12DRAFT_708726 [Crucibulum laeve]
MSNTLHTSQGQSSNKALSSPIKSLAPELLGAIFEEAKPHWRRSRLSTPFEIILSHVCRNWRGVVTSMPSMWTTMEFYSLQSRERVSSYLQRAGALPLDIRLDLYSLDKDLRQGTATLPTLDSIIDLILPHIQRCRSLLLLTYYEASIYHILSHLAGVDAPVLERLRVNFCVSAVLSWSDLSMSDLGSITLFSGRAPRLTFLETEMPSIMPPLTYLTTLHLHGLHQNSPITYEYMLELATNASALQNLSIRGLTLITSWPLDFMNPSFQMKELRSLLVGDDGPLSVKLLLSVNAPQLKSLWLECSFDSFASFFESPQIDGRNKFPALEYLTLHDTDSYQLSAFANSFPSIKYLHLSYPHLFNVKYLESALLRASGNPEIPPWRQLHTMIIRTRNEVHSGRLFDVLFRAIPARKLTGRPILQLLLDRDLLRLAIKATTVIPEFSVAMSQLDTINYREPWWLMSHEDTPDRL